MKKKQQASAPKQPKPVGVIKSVTASPDNQEETDAGGEPDECFKPFIFPADVSLTGRKEDEHQVTVLRDTACSLSLILSNVLPFNSESACHLSTIVRGVGMRLLPAPMHYVHVNSSLISDVFPVALRPCLPVSGVDFILSNDIAGGKMYPTPQVVDAPLIDSVDDLV